jgi:hypothetical protein
LRISTVTARRVALHAKETVRPRRRKLTCVNLTQVPAD